MANCLPINKTPEKRELADRLIKIKDKWFDDPVISISTGESKQHFISFYNRTLPHLDFEYGRLPNKKELNRLERHINKYIKDVYKKPTKLGELFKLPEAILRKNPATKEYFNSLVKASQEYRGNQSSIGSDLLAIKTYLNKASGQAGFMQKYGYSRSQSSIEIAKLENAYKKLMSDGKVELANKLYNDRLKNLGEDGKLSAANALYYLMVDPSLVNVQNYKKTSLEYGDDLARASKLWHYGDTKVGSKPLKERLWKMLGNGLRENISILKGMQNDYNKGTFKIDKLEQLYTDYFDPKSATKRIKDYFPRQVLDIAPMFSKLSEDIHSGQMDKSSINQKEIGTYVDRMIEDVTNNLKQPGVIYERANPAPAIVSKDVLGILDSYSQNVMRFNYSTFVTSATTKALKKLQKLEGAQLDTQIGFLAEYVNDTHQSVLGLKYRNSKFKNISRAITSWQFMSKLGLNVRSAARNASQSLQNWVYFGNKAIYEAMKDLQIDSKRRIVDNAMRKNGFEFVNIQEFAVPKELLGNVEIDATGKVIETGASTGAKFNDFLENVARITGKPMQWVENHVNRGFTFKIAFLQKYNEANDSMLRKYVKKKYKKPKGVKAEDWDTELMGKIETERQARASAYARDVVKELHYLYDAWAKPKALRNPVGSVLGQFTTYSINFFEYQRKILAKGGDDLMHREWNTPEAWRMYRLGMLYTFVTALSAATNTQWSNLIENDTYERIVRLNQWLGGTAEEKEKAFFGQGPVTATFGGPFVSDMLRIGSLINFDKMSGDDMNSYLENYRSFNKRTGEMSATEEVVRTLNTQVGRLIYNTGPRIMSGTSFPTVLGQELGLYKARDLDNWRDAMLYPLQKWTPKPVSEYFTPPKSKPKSVGNARFSLDEIDSIFKSLENL